MTTLAPYNLESAGFVPRAAGEVLLTGSAKRLFDAWNAYLCARLHPLADTVLDAPAFIDRQTLEAVHYLRNFPQHLYCCHNLLDADAPERHLAPTACLHVYPTLAGRPLSKWGVTVLVTGSCARHEGGSWAPPFRLANFHMLELVMVGPRNVVEAQREAVGTLVVRALRDAGLGGDLHPATDALFPNDGDRLLKLLKGLKQEYRAPTGDGSTMPVASVNDHEDYFGRRFGLRTADGEAAWSCCVAFGLERLTALGLLRWGPHPNDWPSVLRPAGR